MVSRPHGHGMTRDTSSTQSRDIRVMRRHVAPRSHGHGTDIGPLVRTRRHVLSRGRADEEPRVVPWVVRHVTVRTRASFLQLRL